VQIIISYRTAVVHVPLGKDVDVRSLRVFGVLQRLALTYCVVAVTEVLCVVPPNQHAVRNIDVNV